MELCWSCHAQFCPAEVQWAKLVGPGVTFCPSCGEHIQASVESYWESRWFVRGACSAEPPSTHKEGIYPQP